MYKNKISAVYKIVNTVTGDFYIGSSKNVEKRWASHKRPSTWEEHPNSPLYQDMHKYGLDCFSFEVLEEVETQYLKQVEQSFIDMLNPTYNNYNAKGLDVERRKEYQNKYQHSEKGKEVSKKYYQSEKGKEVRRKYTGQLCEYNGETLTLDALRCRFSYAGISHPVLEAKKYLINTTN